MIHFKPLNFTILFLKSFNCSSATDCNLLTSITISVGRSGTMSAVTLRSLNLDPSLRLTIGDSSPFSFITVRFPLYKSTSQSSAFVFTILRCILDLSPKVASLSNSKKTPSNPNCLLILWFGGLNRNQRSRNNFRHHNRDRYNRISFFFRYGRTDYRNRNIRQHLLSFRNLSGSVECYFLQFTCKLPVQPFYQFTRRHILALRSGLIFRY